MLTCWRILSSCCSCGWMWLAVGAAVACGNSRDDNVRLESSGAGAGDSAGPGVSAGTSAGERGDSEESDPDGGDTSTSGNAGSSGGSPSSDAEPTSESDRGEESDATSDGPRFDIGTTAGSAMGDDGIDHADCEKIDFLFSIDNSGSMTKAPDQADEQLRPVHRYHRQPSHSRRLSHHGRRFRWIGRWQRLRNGARRRTGP